MPPAQHLATLVGATNSEELDSGCTVRLTIPAAAITRFEYRGLETPPPLDWAALVVTTDYVLTHGLDRCPPLLPSTQLDIVTRIFADYDTRRSSGELMTFCIEIITLYPAEDDMDRFNQRILIMRALPVTGPVEHVEEEGVDEWVEETGEQVVEVEEEGVEETDEQVVDIEQQ